MPIDSHQLQPDWLNAQCPREGRYVVGPLLGRGGMGHVHEAWDVVLCRTVALKILKDIEPAALIRFMHEAQIHARVVHPNICRIYDVDNYEGSLRVAMQLVQGPNLEQARTELTAREAVTILALVAQAVHVVHRLNLVHRDLKPSNILLERGADGQWTPFVCDFGLAMALDEPALTFTHGVIGTPAFMAPEQLNGQRERISPATDVYALGGTLHFVLTGHAPAGATGLQVPAPEPALPRDLRAVIGKCLDADPEQRYPTASALAEDLWSYLQGAPVQASRRRFLGRLKGLRRWRSAYLVLAGAVLASAFWGAQQFLARRAGGAQKLLAGGILADAEAQARDFRVEEATQVHDLRPSCARIRASMESDRQRLADLGPDWRGQVHFALGSLACLVRDWTTARTELKQALAAGFRTQEAYDLLASAAVPLAASAEEEAGFRQDGTAAADRFLVPALQAHPGPGAGGVLPFLTGDYARGAAASRADFLASPWHWDSAEVECECLMALARQERNAGGLAGARSRYQETMAAAQAGLAAGASDPDLHLAYLRAGRGVVSLDLERGALQRPFLAGLLDASDRALRLDPGDPDLQDGWLGLRLLQARWTALQGQDPGPDLDAARTYLETWVREPLTARLRADRMMLYWLVAQHDAQLGRDPGPALAESMKTAGHTLFFLRDYYWDLLNFKARTDAARGVDPRPALAPALQRLASPQQDAPWSLKESLADSWLICAEWERAHGADPAASLRNARELAESAGSQNPASASAFALEGLGAVLELRTFPGERARLLPLARERLGQALARSPLGPRQARLRRELQSLDK